MKITSKFVKLSIQLFHVINDMFQCDFEHDKNDFNNFKITLNYIFSALKMIKDSSFIIFITLDKCINFLKCIV